MIDGTHIVALCLGGAIVALGMRAHYAKQHARWLRALQALRERLKGRAA